MISEADLVGLLYRADWARLRLAAEVSWRADYGPYEDRGGLLDEMGAPEPVKLIAKTAGEVTRRAGAGAAAAARVLGAIRRATR